MTECKTQLTYKIVRIALGLLLLAAVILKAYEVATGPVDGNGFLASRFFSIGLVLFELLFALLLLSNLYPRIMWLAAACLFTVFAAVSFYKGVSGAASCGCFGRVQVNPWWTFGLDTVIVAALLRWRPSWRDERAVGVLHVRFRLASVGVLFVLIGGPAGYWMATREPARLTVAGVIEGNGNLVILEPEKWVGQPLPIRSHIDIGDRLAVGRWTLLLYHHDCPECLEVMPKYERAARMRNSTHLSQNASSTPAAPSSRGAPLGVRIAFVEVPPYGQVPHSSTASPIVNCRMSNDRDWFVQTPVEIQLEDGKVTQVFTELKFLYSSHGGGNLMSDQSSECPLPKGFLLSVVVPVYNEVSTLAQLLERIRNSGVPCEIIFVDDGSTDGTRELLQGWHDREDLRICLHTTNQGKGAALRTGFAVATGDIVLIQDGDLEYNPDDYRRLIGPILQGEADVVYGSRFQEGWDHLYGWFYAGNRLLTMVSNVVSGLALTDMETCYKTFRREVLEVLAPQLQENRFGIEPEITARVARMRDVRICEVPISYQSRSFAGGKKIRLHDGLRALWCIFRYGVGR